MRHVCLVLLLLMSLCTAGAAAPSHLLHKAYSEKYLYFDSLNRINENDFYPTIDALIKWAEAEKDDQLRGELLHLKMKRHIQSGEQIDEKALQTLALYAHDHKQIYLEVKSLQLLGDYYGQLRKFAHATDYYYRAYTLYSSFTPKEFPDKREFLYSLGSAYRNYGDDKKAITCLRESLASREPNNAQVTTIENSLGVCYRHIHRYDSAEWFFRRVYEDALKRNDSSWIGISAGNIGITYYLQGRYDDAIPLLEKDITLSIATTQIQNAANSMAYLSFIYHARNQLDKSENLLIQALHLSEAKPFWPNYELAEKLYGTLSKVYAGKHDMARAYLYADSTIMAKDSVRSIFNALTLANALEQSSLEQQKLQTEKLESQRRFQTMVRNSLIVGILLVTIIALLLANRQRLRQKKLEAEMKSADLELAAATRQLSTYRQSVEEKDSLIEQYTAELESIKHNPQHQTDEEVLTQLENSIILTDEQWTDFRKLFDKVHKNFFVNLKKKYPDLSQAEVRFMALARLKLSSREMASMLGISTNAIRIYRHRLRKKLGLDKDDMIEQLVEQL